MRHDRRLAADDYIKLSAVNRNYHKALMTIKNTLKKPSKATSDAIVDAENAAFEVERTIGELFALEDA